MTPVEIFGWGFGGSLAVEIMTLYQQLQLRSVELPERYRKVAFWVVRVLVAAIAGALALGYEIQKPLLAANVGAAAPLIIQMFAQGVRPLADSTTPGGAPAQNAPDASLPLPGI